MGQSLGIIATETIKDSAQIKREEEKTIAIIPFCYVYMTEDNPV
jgi:hypothetical protein